MKAAVLTSFGAPLVVEAVPDPVLGTGEVIVDVVAAGVLSYADEVISGKRRHLLDLPVILGSGGVGRVREVGPDATHLAPGDWVYCDPTVRSRDQPSNPDITLQGWSARGDGGLRLQKHFGNGSWAEQVRLPTENAIPIGAINEADAPAWCALGSCLVPYGGFLAADLRAGETLLVNGATGNFGSAAVAVALAMGAGCVIATGRNQTVLTDLSRRFGERVRTVRTVGDERGDHERMLDAAPGPIDCVLDILPPAATTAQVRAAVTTVRPYGRVVLMGGVNMQGGPGLELPYVWIMRSCITIHGVWMYPPHAPAALVALVRAGLVKLDQATVSTFALDDVDKAVDHAAAHAGPFEKTVLLPQPSVLRPSDAKP